MIHIAYGTRAELINLSSLIRELQKRKIEFKLVDFGQHDTESFRKSMNLPKPEYHFGKSYRKHWSKLESRFMTYPIAAAIALSWGAKAFSKFLNILAKEGKVVVTHGNTMVSPISVYAAKFLPNKKIKLVHLQAGMRANSKRSLLLDTFFRIADHNSHYLFANYKSSLKNLKKEKVSGKTIHCGAPTKEIVAEYLEVKPKIKSPKSDYVLVNSTRSIITKKDANEFVKALLNSPFNSVFVVNPVIKDRLKNFGLFYSVLSSEKIYLLDQVDYPDFLHLIKNSKCVITDSTGVQEESAILGKPCIVTNDFTHIPELVESSSTFVVGCNSNKILKLLNEIKTKRFERSYLKNFKISDGKATQRIADFLETLL